MPKSRTTEFTLTYNCPLVVKRQSKEQNLVVAFPAVFRERLSLRCHEVFPEVFIEVLQVIFPQQALKTETLVVTRPVLPAEPPNVCRTTWARGAASYLGEESQEFCGMMPQKSLPLLFNYPSTQRLPLLLSRSFLRLQFLEEKLDCLSRSFKTNLTLEDNTPLLHSGLCLHVFLE